MAIAPNDPRHPDLTVSDVLSPNAWPRRGVRPLVGLDVLCTKIAVDFQTMTAETAATCIQTNLELLRESTRSDTAFHLSLDTEVSALVDVQVARGMLVTGNPEQLKGQSLDALPWLKSRLASLRVSELRDTGHPRPDQAEDAAVWANLGIGSILVIGYFIEGRPAGLLGIAGARPRDNWEVQLHLLMKLVGSSLATGLERIEIQAQPHLLYLGADDLTPSQQYRPGDFIIDQANQLKNNPQAAGPPPAAAGAHEQH